MSKSLGKPLLALLFLVSLSSAGLAQLSENDRTFLRLSTQTYQQRWREEGKNPAEIDAILRGAGRDLVSTYRAYMKALTIMGGTTWSPDAELYNSMDYMISSKVVGPDDPLKVNVSFIFDAPAATNGPYKVELEVLKTDETKEAAVPVSIDLGDLATRKAKSVVEVSFVPSKVVPNGLHLIKGTLKDSKGNSHGVYYRSFFIVPDLKTRVAALDKACEGLSESDAGAQTARYVLDSTKTANTSYLGGSYQNLSGCLHTVYRARNYARNEVMNFDAELDRATKMASGVKEGKFTIDGLRGDQKLAYRSTGDGKLVPYRIYVPSNYDKSKPWPFAILLHGAGGDENSFFDGYDKKWTRLAEERGYIIIGVSGRGPLGGYSVGNPGERDMLDLVALAEKNFNIDPNREYLAGHSMGGQGTWNLGLAHRDKFAAIVPMAGTRAANNRLNAGTKVPILVVAGVKDALFPIAASRSAFQTMKATGYPIEYKEYAEGDHTTCVTMAVEDVYNFLDAHKKTGAPAQAK